MRIKSIIKYCWNYIKCCWDSSILRFAFAKSVWLALLISGILAVIYRYLQDKQPDWSTKMKTPIWLIPVCIFLLWGSIRLILASYIIRRKIYLFLKPNLSEILQAIEDKEEIFIYMNKSEVKEFKDLTKYSIYKKFLSFEEYGTQIIGFGEMTSYHLCLTNTFIKYLKKKGRDEIQTSKI